MFHKRKKIIFPEGTFIPTKARVLSIIQLCLGFTALLFAASEPFMGQHFTIKSKILIYDYVMGKNHVPRANLFNELSAENREEIIQNYQNLKNKLSTSFLDKIQESLNVLFFKTSSFERAWILFAIIIPILLLKKVEGSREAAWILPLIVTAYCISNELKLSSPHISDEAKLFPKEEFLVSRYLKKNINTLGLAAQQEELLKGWHLYLVEYYANEIASRNLNEFQNQIEKGEFAFNLARIEKSSSATSNVLKKQPLFLMMIYFVWNLLFALGVSTFSVFNRLKKVLS